MATFLDLGILEHLVPLFSFVFVFLIIYALLQKLKLLGGKSAIDFLVSLTVSLLVILSSSAIELARFMSVWGVVVIVILVFMFIMMSFWAKDGDLGLPEDMDVKGIVFWIFIIILAIGLTQVFGPVLTPYAEGADPSRTILRTIFHPRIVGALFLLIIIGNLAKLLKFKS
ncbi:hypothetical protein HOG16_01535 [Candidatus Woesearchaeota archaeon]|nr:hypothetical protein [Candidatus Woesearchaeota archaeon]MBT4321905.1 hypothetical protein [Candidatus Woesearchaeota archaeon]